MIGLRHSNAIPLRRLRAWFTPNPRRQRHPRRRDDARQLIGRDLAHGALRRTIPVWLIPGIVVGTVIAALAIAHVRIELIDQGYKRYSAVERHQALEEEQRNLIARVRELRDPARLASLAKKMGLARPAQAIALAPPGNELRP